VDYLDRLDATIFKIIVIRLHQTQIYNGLHKAKFYLWAAASVEGPFARRDRRAVSVVVFSALLAGVS
jgi:hypothetical protein